MEGNSLHETSCIAFHVVHLFNGPCQYPIYKGLGSRVFLIRALRPPQARDDKVAPTKLSNDASDNVVTTTITRS
jgi:hypothetical protein